MIFDAIIVGGGAAGLFCAIEAGKRGRRVLVIEHNHQVGRKIIISGGGRCNFTNIHARAENFISANPHFCKSALARYAPQDFIALVEKHGIEYYEKKLGQLFCRQSSRQIVEMLLAECRSAGVEIRLGCSVNEVSKGEKFSVETNQGKFASENLVIATGGLSISKLGATDFGYRIAAQFGLRTNKTRPALVPLVFENGFPPVFKKLAGVSLDAEVSFGRTSFRENILFTHKGLSGPAILQISSYWKPGEAISIDLLPSKNALELLQNVSDSRKNFANFLGEILPNRLAEVWTGEFSAAKPLRAFSPKELIETAEKLENWRIAFTETAGYDKAEVTLGGVSTDELSSQTMESKRVGGLFFIGEVIDVTGWLGGYNFQWAWSSGFAAGQAI
ncbi:MAG: NAD(P)/FAD-dependent oxidoreductase [Pyrinomonadaceae bacterium]